MMSCGNKSLRHNYYNWIIFLQIESRDFILFKYAIYQVDGALYHCVLLCEDR